MAEKYVHQFRTIDDLRDLVKRLDRIYARPTAGSGHPTLYQPGDVPANDRLLGGARFKDWKFSADEMWVLPDAEKGLSFSAHWQHLKAVFKLKEKHNPGEPVQVYWVLETADIPTKMKFVADRNNDQHFLLTVTETMTVWELISKLSWLADRMSVMQDMRKVL